MDAASRPYRGEVDRFLIHDLLLHSYRSGPSTCSVADFEWWQVNDDDPDALRTVRLWFAGDRLAAFSWPSGDALDVVSHPDCRDLEAAIFDDWILGQSGRNGRLSINTLERDLARIAALDACGFVSVERTYNVWAQPLKCELPSIEPPDGYIVRGFAGEQEIESRVAAHRSAFHPSRMTTEKHRRATVSPLYRQDLDLVAVAAGGEVASYALVWFDESSRTGFFEPVGAHADHRRRGLSRAVIQEGLRRLQSLGATLAYVNGGASNVPSNRLYASCGFEIVDREARWERPVELATTPPA